MLLIFLTSLGIMIWLINDECARSRDRSVKVQHVCCGCQAHTESDWLVCPRCSTLLQEHCPGCGRSHHSWQHFCPWCGNGKGDSAA